MHNPFLRLIFVVGVAAQLARVFSVSSVDKGTPFLSANDRSRWCTIASLVEDRSFAIDRIIDIRDRQGKRPWYTIDMVRHLGPDGKLHYYSSKPPLLSVLYAGVYQGIYSATGMRLTEHPFYVGRILIVLVNTLPLALFWWAFANWVDRSGLRSWSKIVIFTFLSWGTFLTTFASVLNNHLPATLAIGLSMLMWSNTDRNKRPSIWQMIWLGLLASFGAACELPALSWVGMLGLLILLRHGFKFAAVYSASLLPVALAFFAANYAAHGELRPAYAQRGLGPQIASYAKDASETSEPLMAIVQREMNKQGKPVSDQATIVPARFSNAWSLWDDVNNLSWTIVNAKDAWTIHQSGDWYDYPKSYWRDENRRGVDRGEPSRLLYTFHLFIGHHGLFALTPFWLLAVVGAWRLRHETNRDQWLFELAICVVSVVCMVFYVMRPEIDRNYGGVSCTFRWLVWLSPAWIILSSRGLRFVQTKRWPRGLVQLALLVSVFSATYPWSNPWVHPWLFTWWSYLQWIQYP